MASILAAVTNRKTIMSEAHLALTGRYHEDVMGDPAGIAEIVATGLFSGMRIERA